MMLKSTEGDLLPLSFAKNTKKRISDKSQNPQNNEKVFN